MTTFAPCATAPILSADAELLLGYLHAAQVRWIVLGHVRSAGAAELSDDEFRSAVEELEAADLVERAPYGPLLYIR